jgi:hypothetical protein
MILMTTPFMSMAWLRRVLRPSNPNPSYVTRCYKYKQATTVTTPLLSLCSL